MSAFTRAFAALQRLPNPVKVVGALGALVGLILGVIQLYNIIFPAPEPAARSVLFVVDSSPGMRDPFGAGQTKFNAVRREILRFVRSQPDVLVGLRFVGSMCGGKYGPPEVGFGTHNEEDVARALGQARPARIADLPSGVGNGANDFVRDSRAGKSPAPSMWVFFSGTEDQCGGLGSLADEIAVELQNVKVHARFDFFAVRKTLAGRKELARLVANLERQGHEARWLQPRNPRALRRIVTTVARGEMPSVR
jgi:hypothetical protein